MAKKCMTMLSTLLLVALLVACLPAASRAAEPAPGEDAGATTSPERPPVHEQYAAPEEPPCPQYGSPPDAWQEEDTTPGAAGVAPTAADPGARYDDDAQGAQYDPDAPYPSDRGTYEDPCSGDTSLNQEAAVEPAAEDAQSTDDALAEAHEAGAARQPAEEALVAEPAAAPASSARTAEVYPGTRNNDPATSYPSDVAEPAALDARDTDAAPDEAREITASDPPDADPVADPDGPAVLDAGGTEQPPERVREGSGEPEAEYVVREPVPHAPQPPVSLPLATADPVASTANQEAHPAAGDTNAGAPAPKEPLIVPAQEVPPEEAGPRTEEPAALPIATLEAAPEQRAFLAPEPPRKAAAEATKALSAVPLSATGGSLLLALGVGALIYGRRLGR